MYDVNLDYYEIISGTSNRLNPVYLEAAEANDKQTPAGAARLKTFLQNIEDMAKDGGRDKRITASKGNINNFEGTKNIEKVLSFLKKNLGKVEGVSECDKLFESLKKLAPQYEKGYDKQVRLIILEYESAVYILVTALSMFMATKMDFVADGTEIRIKKKSESTHGVIEKTLKGLSEIISKPDHKDYLEEICEATKKIDTTPTEIKESVSFVEAAAGESLALVASIISGSAGIVKGVIKFGKSIVRTVFGIVPLIRSCIYLHYKKKADTISALEAQAAYIDENIEQLKNRTNMDEGEKALIIRRQEAKAESARKRAAKLRAELMETEKEVSKDSKIDDQRIKESIPTREPERPRTPEPSSRREETPKKETPKREEPKQRDDDGDLVLEWVQKAFPVVESSEQSEDEEDTRDENKEDENKEEPVKESGLSHFFWD